MDVAFYLFKLPSRLMGRRAGHVEMPARVRFFDPLSSRDVVN